MNNTSTRTEILEALDNVENVTMESSFDVMFTMADSYDKAAVILENYNGSDINSFAIFQEDGENNTAVQQGNASGNTNAEAK
jgi:glycerol-3-phosphate cytidylyltransferase-like family protein